MIDDKKLSRASEININDDNKTNEYEIKFNLGLSTKEAGILADKLIMPFLFPENYCRKSKETGLLKGYL